MPALLTTLAAGRVNGSTYSGACACLVGTIANTLGCDYRAVPSLTPDSSRPAERWFLAIREGHTPENNQIARITAEWIGEWIAAHPSK